MFKMNVIIAAFLLNPGRATSKPIVTGKEDKTKWSRSRDCLKSQSCRSAHDNHRRRMNDLLRARREETEKLLRQKMSGEELMRRRAEIRRRFIESEIEIELQLRKELENAMD